MLSEGEITKGMIITAFEGRKYTTQGGSWMFGGTTTATEHEDTSYVGEILKVLEINLPFMVCKVIKGVSSGRNVVVNTRARKFMELTPEFVAAALEERDGKK